MGCRCSAGSGTWRGSGGFVPEEWRWYEGSLGVILKQSQTKQVHRRCHRICHTMLLLAAAERREEERRWSLQNKSVAKREWRRVAGEQLR